MPTVIKGQPTSDVIRQELADKGEPVILAFSCGKDSIATWVALEEAGIEVVPAYLYLVPNLQFVLDSLAYFEEVFEKPIGYYPHPSAFRYMESALFQPYERLPILSSFGLPKDVTYEQVWDCVRVDAGLPENTLVANGVRAADSLARRANFVRSGYYNFSKHKVSPIGDWVKDEVMAAIERKGVELPIDYELFGRSFDGLDARFIEPIRENLPEDFAVLKEWFPFIEADIYRREWFG